MGAGPDDRAAAGRAQRARPSQHVERDRDPSDLRIPRSPHRVPHRRVLGRVPCDAGRGHHQHVRALRLPGRAGTARAHGGLDTHGGGRRRGRRRGGGSARCRSRGEGGSTYRTKGAARTARQVTEERKHILITNDDGIESDALGPLADALWAVGNVDIIVPERNWSGASHSITLYRPLRVKATQLRSGQPAYMSDGSPTDCVRLAVLGFLPHKPDLVVSGINRGSNMGDDITYSGTVAAAMEGLLSNVPSIAISIGAFGANIDFGPAASFAALLAKNILAKGFTSDALLNVNVPALPRERITGVEVTRLGKRNYRDQLVERLDPYGEPYDWVGRPALAGGAEPGTDVAALRDGKISVTPSYLDLTNPDIIHDLATWAWGWTAPVEVRADSLTNST